MHIAKSGIIAAVATAVSLTFAGPNENAEFFIDAAVGSTDIDSTAAVPTDSNFAIGVAIHGAVNLYDYEFYVVYDTGRLRFVSASKGNDKCPNILEKNGGSVIFTGKRSRDDSTRILIGGALMGTEGAEGINGDGFLSLLTFKKLNGDTTELSLANTLVEDTGGIADTMCKSHGAIVCMGSNAVLFRSSFRQKEMTFKYVNGSVRLGIPLAAADCRASIFDATGREIRRFIGRPAMMEADMRSAPQGVYYVAIIQGKKTSSYPLIIKK